MNNNQRANQIAIKQFRKELKAMLDDVSEIDARILTKAVSIGVADVKRNTPVVTSFMRKSWKSTPIAHTRQGIKKSIANYMDYASFVNDGHRLVNGAGETTGWVNGQFMLEKAEHKVNKALEVEFRKEIERVNREHDK